MTTSDAMALTPPLKKKLLTAAVLAGVLLLAWWLWRTLSDDGPGEGFVSGNGRIEATEIDVATKIAGRIKEIFVDEGDSVTSGQPLARMDTATLEAERREADQEAEELAARARAVGLKVHVRHSHRATHRTGTPRNVLARVELDMGIEEVIQMLERFHA